MSTRARRKRSRNSKKYLRPTIASAIRKEESSTTSSERKAFMPGLTLKRQDSTNNGVLFSSGRLREVEESLLADTTGTRTSLETCSVPAAVLQSPVARLVREGISSMR